MLDELLDAVRRVACHNALHMLIGALVACNVACVWMLYPLEPGYAGAISVIGAALAGLAVELFDEARMRRALALGRPPPDGASASDVLMTAAGGALVGAPLELAVRAAV